MLKINIFQHKHKYIYLLLKYYEFFNKYNNLMKNNIKLGFFYSIKLC